MPSATRQQLVGLIAELPQDPSDADLASVVRILSSVAARTPKRPAASVQAMLRYSASALPRRLRDRLAKLAIDNVRDTAAGAPSNPPPARPTGVWYTLSETAARLVIGDDTLLRRLDHHEHRRRLGYPHWDAYRWHFSSLAVEPETSAKFLAALPEHEPLEELLPDWCIREGQMKAPRDARSEEERHTLLRRADPSPVAATRVASGMEYEAR